MEEKIWKTYLRWNLNKNKEQNIYQNFNNWNKNKKNGTRYLELFLKVEENWNEVEQNMIFRRKKKKGER